MARLLRRRALEAHNSGMDTFLYIAGFILSGLCGCCAGACAVILLALLSMSTSKRRSTS